jgi:triacylglycerol esterase/lipase EstA (alpha/beta hydrolase family)
MVLGVLASVAAAVLTFHGATTVLWLYEARRSGACPGSVPFSWRAWWVEALAFAVVVVTWPLGHFGGRRPGGARGRRPVLLVHGWSLNRASMLVLAARLRSDGREVLAINYPSLRTETDAKWPTVAAAIRALAQTSPDGRVDVVGHSLGGVLVRAAARDAELRSMIGNVVTLGSPHHGTALAFVGRRYGLIQLRPHSHYLDRLASEDRLAEATNVTTVASPFDTIVFPTDTAHLSGGLNVTIDAIGHHTLLYSARVYALLRENLDHPLRRAAA